MYQDLDFTDNNYYQEDYIDSPVDDFDWMPNLFAKLANHLRTSTSADVIRLGTIGSTKGQIHEITPEDGYETALILGAKLHRAGVHWLRR